MTPASSLFGRVCLFAFAATCLLALPGQTASSRSRFQAKTIEKKLQPLAKPMPDVRPNDWLAQHKEEGQSLIEYIQQRPMTFTAKRKHIYIQPLGSFNKDEQRVLDATNEYLQIFFGSEVKTLPAIALTSIPAHARRYREDLQHEQILSTYILDKILRPKRPADAAAVLCVTASDLYPQDDWNFVFGQASYAYRVGVWSIARNGDPAGKGFSLCLNRTIKTASHEIGHMLSMEHCTAHLCNMNGSNHRQESDSKPLFNCPVCSGKLSYATGGDPLKRAEELLVFSKRYDFQDAARYFKEAILLLKRK